MMMPRVNGNALAVPLMSRPASSGGLNTLQA
jgi:hypothetical protein